MDINRHSWRALAVGVSAILILMVGGCRRPPGQTAATRTSGSAEQVAQERPEAASDEKRTEALRVRGRNVLGRKLSQQLDRAFGYWALFGQKEVLGARFLTLKTIPDPYQDWATVVVLPGGKVFVTISQHSQHSVKLQDLRDVDGDGHKDVVLWIWNGGNSGLNTCLFLKLHPDACVLGGNDYCPNDCGQAADLDHDGLIEFVTSDFSFERFDGARAGPILPYVYGFRNGRFVDLTATLARAKVLRQLEGRPEPAHSRPEAAVRGKLV